MDQHLLCHESGTSAGTRLAVAAIERHDPTPDERVPGKWGLMVDRQTLEAILRRRFAGATDQQVASAANAIMGLVTPRPFAAPSAISRESWMPDRRSARDADERYDRAQD